MRESEVTLRQEDVGQVEFGIRDGFGITSLPGPFSSPAVEVEGTAEIPALAVEPAEGVEDTVVPDFVAHLLGEDQSFLKRCEGLVVVSLASQGHPIIEETEQERHEQVMLPRQLQGFSLKAPRRVLRGSPPERGHTGHTACRAADAV